MKCLAAICPLGEMDITSGFEPELGGSNPPEGTIEEIASFEGLPRFTRRLIRIQF